MCECSRQVPKVCLLTCKLLGMTHTCGTHAHVCSEFTRLLPQQQLKTSSQRAAGASHQTSPCRSKPFASCFI